MRKANTKTVVYAVGLLGSLLFLGVTLRSPSTESGVQLATPATTEKGATAPAVTSASGRLVQAAPTDADMKRYEMIINRDIFSPPRPPQDRRGMPPIGPAFQQPIIIAPQGPAPPPPPPEPPSLAGWTYVGYYQLDGVTKGVIQNDNNDSARFLAQGEEFLTYKVESISSKEIVLTVGSKRVPLARATDYSVAPLEGMTGQPARPPGPAGRRGG